MTDSSSTTVTGYSLEVLSEITGISYQSIIQYHEHGLIPTCADDDTVRHLRRMEHLRESFDMSLRGVKLIDSLLDQLEELRAELRARR